VSGTALLILVGALVISQVVFGDALQRTGVLT
jgi:hypothetical protein